MTECLPDPVPGALPVFRWEVCEDWGWELCSDNEDYGIACYYDERPEQYAIFAYGGPLEHIWPHTTLSLPRTPANDADIQVLVATLQRLARRKDAGHTP